MSKSFLNLQSHHALLFLVICVAFVQSALASREFDVYRLVSFEKDGKPFGSKISSFNLVGTHYTGDLLRKLAVIQLSEINAANLEELINKKPSGLLVILSKGQFREEEAQIWRVLSENLVAKSVQIPVYFCEENETVQQFYERSKAASTGEKSGRQIGSDIDSTMNFIVTSAEPKLLRSVAMEDFYGVFDENTPATRISTNSNPVILVVASYDSFTFVPDAKLGFNQFSSGSIALLNIAKQLSDFSESNKEISYNILFYLTSSRTFSFEGLETWFNRAENSRIANRIEFALFLDSVGGNNNLRFEVYNINQDNSATVTSTTRKLEAVAKNFGVHTETKNAETTFLNGKFPIIRVSDSSAPIKRPFNEWTNGLNFNLDAFKRNLVFLTEFLINSAYGIDKNFRLFDSNQLNQEFLSASLNLFGSKSTFPPQITKESTFTQELYRAFSEVVKHPNKNLFTYNSIQFYTTAKAKAKITRISSAFFDFYLFLANVTWLSILYFVVSRKSKPVEEAAKQKKDDLKARSKSPRKVD